MARGTAIVNLLQLQPEEKISAIIPLKKLEPGKFIFMATKFGMVKKTPMEDFANIRKTGLQAINMREEDELIEVKYTDGDRELLLVSMKGMCIRFHERDVRPTGRSSMGVRGMDLGENDIVIGMQMDSQGEYLLLATSRGLGKKTRISEFNVQMRGGKGVKCYKLNEKTGDLVGVKAVKDGQELMIVTTNGIIIRISIDGVSILGRVASGVKLIGVDDKTGLVASIAKVKNEETEKNDDNDEQEIDQDADDAVNNKE